MTWRARCACTASKTFSRAGEIRAAGTSGTVTLTSVSGNRFSGNFDLVLDSGDHVTGSFDPEECPALNTALDNSMTSSCI